MNITKFKLIDNGLSGIQFKGTDVIIKEGNAQIMVDLDKTFHVPVPKDLTNMVQDLKYFFLKMCGFLPSECEKFFDQEYGRYNLVDYRTGWDRHWWALAEQLYNATQITGFSYGSTGVVITAKMKGMEEMTFAVNTPLLKLAMAMIGFEDDLTELLIKIKKAVTIFVEDVKLRKMEPKQYLIEFAKEDQKEVARVNNLTDEEAEKEQIKKLQDKGFIVFHGEEVVSEILTENVSGEWAPEPVVSDGKKEELPQFTESPEDLQQAVYESSVIDQMKTEGKEFPKTMDDVTADPPQAAVLSKKNVILGDVTMLPETGESVPSSKTKGKSKTTKAEIPA